MYSGGYSQSFKSASADNLTQLDDGDGSKHNKVKRLSLETNRRRRELAVRLKREAEKEEKRKQEILEQRREKQRQATERFQRCFSARSRRSPVGFRARSPSRGAELDAMLQLIRGPSAGLQRQASWDSVRHHAWPAAADAADPWRRAEPEQSNNSAAKFQVHLEEHQQRFAAEQRRLAAFSKVVESFVEPEAAPVDSLESWAGQNSPKEASQPAKEEPPPSAIPVPKARVQPPVHYRFVVAEEPKEQEVEAQKEEMEEEKEEEESVTNVASSGVKSILKRKSVYSPPGQRSSGQGVRDSLEVTRGHRLLGRSHSEERLPTEEPEGRRRRKSVRFATRLTEDLASPRREEAEAPNPKPRRVFTNAPAPAAPRVAGKPPQHPGASPGRSGPRPERVTSATLAKVAAQNATSLRQRVPSTEDVSGIGAEPAKATTGETTSQATVQATGQHYVEHAGAEAIEEVQEQQQQIQQQQIQQQQIQQKQAQQQIQQQQFLQQQIQQKQAQQQQIQQKQAQQQQIQQKQAQQQLQQQQILQQQIQQKQSQQQQSYQQRHMPQKSAVAVPTGSQPRFSNSEPYNNEHSGPSASETSSRAPNGPLTGDSLENFPMDKTPTESDIEWLWAKVRSCLHRPEGSSVGGDSNSELSIQSAPARAVAPMSSQLIDGASIHLGAAGRGRLRGGRFPEPRAVHHSITPHSRRLALLRQREMNQHLQRSPADSLDASVISESMAEFLENEAICQQSLNSTAPAANGRWSAASETPDAAPPSRPPSGTTARRRVVSRDQYRPPSLQPYSPGSYLAPHPPPARKGSAGPHPHLANGYRPMSSLSIEEQRLMKSLERINDKLKATGLSK